MPEDVSINVSIKERIDIDTRDFPPLHAPNYKGNKKLAIVGLASTTRDAAPFDDPEYDIWSMHMGPFLLKRVDVSFEFHNPDDFKKPQYADKAYYEKITKMEIPIFMRKHYDDIPTSIPYPIETIVQEFGRYFTNSVAYMLALAFRNNYDEVLLYGVEMEHGTEYVDQARSVIYFIGLLMGKGVKVGVPPICQLFKNRYLYGLETDQQDEDIQKIEARRAELQGQLRQVSGQVDAMSQQKYMLQGAIAETETINRRILQSDPH